MRWNNNQSKRSIKSFQKQSPIKTPHKNYGIMALTPREKILFCHEHIFFFKKGTQKTRQQGVAYDTHAKRKPKRNETFGTFCQCNPSRIPACRLGWSCGLRPLSERLQWVGGGLLRCGRVHLWNRHSRDWCPSRHCELQHFPWFLHGRLCGGRVHPDSVETIRYQLSTSRKKTLMNSYYSCRTRFPFSNTI